MTQPAPPRLETRPTARPLAGHGRPATAASRNRFDPLAKHNQIIRIEQGFNAAAR